MEKALVQAWTSKLLDVGFMELSICFNHNDAIQKGYFWQLDKAMHVWGLSPNQQALVLKKKCHALSKGDI
jgi:hypothetical protein